jgi:hypothetical protein
MRYDHRNYKNKKAIISKRTAIDFGWAKFSVKPKSLSCFGDKMRLSFLLK